MCIAVYKPADKEIDYATLQRCYEANPDGCGLAYINSDGFLDIIVSMDFNVWYHNYLQCLQDNPDSPFLLHFRIATHGSIDTDNCHPFFIDDNTVFMHNGTITPMTKYCKKGSGSSDTTEFNNRILAELPQEWYLNPAIKELIEEYIGWSKIVVLDELGDVTIFNEHKGTWDSGIWYSNTSYQEKKVIPFKATKGFLEASYMKCDFCDSWQLDVERYLNNGFAYSLCTVCAKEFKETGMELKLCV